MEVLLIGSVFLVLMILGVPIGTSLGVAGVVTIYQFDLGIEIEPRAPPSRDLPPAPPGRAAAAGR